MAQLDLLLVNVGIAAPREASVANFMRQCRTTETEGAGIFSRDLLNQPCDLICVNFDYPDMAGLKLAMDIKKHSPSIPLVMLALQPSADLAVWALRSRVFDLLAKPITSAEIERCLDRVQTALQAKRSQSERKPHMSLAQLPAATRYRPHVTITPRLQAAISYILKHYVRHIPESEVAALCEMSPSRFCREFRSAFGLTFVEYIAKHRMSEAKKLLRNPAIAVSDVAAAVGYSDPAYFARVFSKLEGLSPTEYRSRVLTDSSPASTEVA